MGRMSANPEIHAAKGAEMIVAVSADTTFIEGLLRSPFAPQIVQRFVDCPQGFAELFRLDVEDEAAARAGQQIGRASCRERVYLCV